MKTNSFFILIFTDTESDEKLFIIASLTNDILHDFYIKENRNMYSKTDNWLKK